jgi:hypothetical protein
MRSVQASNVLSAEYDKDLTKFNVTVAIPIVKYGMNIFSFRYDGYVEDGRF